ncbi:hypothetical protein Ndes2526B_g08993 [Nannochloris sp. 'desiccata']
MPCAALQRRIITHSTSNQRFGLRTSCSAIDQSAPSLELIAASPLATQLVAHYFASSILPGDAYLLYGEVGAGKSHFSRAFIRACLRDPTAPVPSPTFLLQNIYPTTTTSEERNPKSPAIHHFDLYRLGQPQDLHRLDLENSLPGCVSLIEWADRMDTTSGLIPEEYVALRITVLSESEKQQELERAAIKSREAGQEESSSDDDEEENDDERWRRIEIWPKGERWRNRVEQLQQHVSARGAALDLYLSS